MTDQEKTKKPMNAREHLRQQSLKNNTGEKAELLDPIANKFTNNTDNDELAKIKKQLADTKKELAKEKKLTANNKGNFSIIAPNKLLDGMPSVDYPFKVFIETMDFIKRNTDGSKNIIFNYLIIRGLEAAKKDLISNDIVLDTGGKEQDS